MFGAMPFCAVTLNMRCIGIPAANVFTLATMGRDGPINICETSPPMTPPKSPRLIGTVVNRLCTGMAVTRNVGAVGIPIACIAMLG